MKYGQFVFECNCGNKTVFEPIEQPAFDMHPNYNSVEEGLKKAGISYTHNTGHDEYMCPDCVEAVNNATQAIRSTEYRSAESAIANRKVKQPEEG